ncbi:MAG TPA: sortase, partial [Thioalkalivibrio sp.]|nr:sortase [Thioalkalivibrio sp.]
GPNGMTGPFSVEAAPPDEELGAITPIWATPLVAEEGTAAEAARLAAPPTDTPASPQQAPEAGQRLAVALPESQHTPRPLASLFLSLAEAVHRDVNAQAAPGTPEAPAAAAAEATAVIESRPPERIRSQAIDLDMEIVPVGWTQVVRDGKTVSMWEVGSHVASWHKTSAMPGQTGNMVITGHNNIEGSVFRRVPDLQEGDEIVVEAGGRPYTYTVESMFVVREKGTTPEQKKWNGQWIGAFPDERLTLVTCYPPDGNSHRMIVIAKPSGR